MKKSITTTGARQKLKTSLLCSAVSILAFPAFGQAGSAPTGSSDNKIDQQGRLGTITVTAQRKSESDQDVPVSITALDKKLLDARGITDMDSLQFAVPSVSIGQSLGATFVTVRGVGRSVGDPGVAINVDGVYQPRNFPMVVAQTDLERVEVLRGPQGTLYGRNANGGAVNFISAAPSDTTEGYIKASYATFNEKTLEVVNNLPIGDAVRTRLALNYSDREEGFIENTAGGEDLGTQEMLSGRFRLAADLTPNLSLDLNLSAYGSDGRTDYYVPTDEPNARGLALNPYLTGVVIAPDYYTTTALGPTSSDRSMQSASVTLDWQLGAVALKSITAYQRVDAAWVMDRDGTNLAIVDAIQDEHSETFSQELNVSGQTGPLDWVGGVYMYDDSYRQSANFDFVLGFSPLPPQSTLSYNTLPIDTEARAIFGDVTYGVTDRFRLIGGARYSEDEQHAFQDHFLGSTVAGSPAISICNDVETRLEDESTTYRLGAQYDVTDDSQVYVMNSTGWKAGGVNYSSCADTFDPETITAYEAGLKGMFLGGNVRFNAAAFYYDYEDFQVREVVGFASSVTNAGSATVKGVEFEADWAPDDHWILNGSLSLLDATYGDFSNTDSLNPDLGLQNLEGRYLSSAPEVSGNLGIAYRTTPTSRGHITARADMSYRSEVFFREFNTEQASQDGYAIVNANLIWESPDNAYTVRLFADNLFDKGYWTAMLAIDGFGGLAGTYGTPRQVGIELKAAF